MACAAGPWARAEAAPQGMHFIPFTAQTRMTGVDFDGTSIRKGAPDSMYDLIQQNSRPVPAGSATDGRADRPQRRHAPGGGPQCDRPWA